MPSRGANFAKEELARVISYYDLGIIQQINRVNAGNMRTAKVVIVSERGKFFLKRRPKGKDDPYRVAFAHSLQTHLARTSFPVPILVQRRNENSTTLQLQGHIYELFEFVEGSRYEGSSEATTDAGRQLARFHVELAEFASNWKPLRGSFHDSTTVRGQLKTLASEKTNANSNNNLRGVGERLMSLYNSASTRVNELGFDSWPEQIVHGDWHPGNMLFSSRKVRAVIDFDSVKLAPPVTDVANGMLQFSIVGGRPNPADWPSYLDQAKLAQFLAGYKELNALGACLLKALLDLMIETMIAEAILPVAATGFFGNLSGQDFLKMIKRKCEWLNQNRDTLIKLILNQQG